MSLQEVEISTPTSVPDRLPPDVIKSQEPKVVPFSEIALKNGERYEKLRQLEKDKKGFILEIDNEKGLLVQVEHFVERDGKVYQKVIFPQPKLQGDPLCLISTEHDFWEEVFPEKLRVPSNGSLLFLIPQGTLFPVEVTWNPQVDQRTFLRYKSIKPPEH